MIKHLSLGFLVFLLAQPLKGQVPIPWNSPPAAVNLLSSGQPMDGSFVFELGVFSGTFVPTAENTGEWAEHWNVAEQTGYNEENARYAAVHNAVGNTAPFTAGKAAYVWGRRPGAMTEEWILFRAASWLWPDASFPAPALEVWEPADATAILGSIESSGSPFLMRSAAVPTSVITWPEWQEEHLMDVVENGPGEDADHDGVANLLEYAFGGLPTVPGPGPPLPVFEVTEGGTRYLAMRVQRPLGRVVDVSVQVSGNLVDWDEGTDFTAVFEDNEFDFVVRDKSPVVSGEGRFMRVVLRLPAE